MDIIVLLLDMVLMTFCRLESKTAKCDGKFELSGLNHGHLEQGIKNHAIVGHSFKNFTLPKIYDCHIQCFDEKCKCQAFQISGDRCELLDEDRYSTPDEFEYTPGYAYFDMSREYIHQVTSDSAYPDSHCSNQCCSHSVCLNGATCTELCQDAKHKFKCSCAPGYVGKFCQKRRTSCKEQLLMDKKSSSQAYWLFDPTSNSWYETFCDFTTENGFVWTLIESFSLFNNQNFADKSFYKDYPVIENDFNWNKFRLSLNRMESIANQSSHVRATCNFNTDGLNFTDYLRAKLTDIDVMRKKFDDCRNYEYINVRGYGCHDCTAVFVQQDMWHAHVDSYYGAGCQLKASGAIKDPGGEDDFGWYGTVNPIHRCSSNNNSTTQWWFGEHEDYSSEQ